MVTTNGFCNFLGNQHWPLMNTENDYRLVLNFSWKSALITNENTQSLKIGSVIFLEISTDPPKESTVCFFWINMFQKPRSLQIGSARYSWKSALISHEHRKWLQIGFDFFLQISTWHLEHTKSLQISFSVFLETSTKPPTRSTVWFWIFLAKTEWALV
jgi:hypothetical protein